MASTISAGITTTTALSYSADTSGVLHLQTNGGTTAVTIDTNQNVGIGTASPAEKLTVTTSGSNVYTKTTDGTVNLYFGITNSSATAISGTISNHPYAFFTNNAERARIDTSGNFLVGATSAANNYIGKTGSEGSIILDVGVPGLQNISFYGVNGTGWNTAATGFKVPKNSSTNRSINAAGTINASGADYAEYMVKAGNFIIAKGDVVGINAEGKLTNVFADSLTFAVKSTNPSYVGGDVWGSEEALGLAKLDESSTDEERATFAAALEAARQTVDRIAFAGQVPVNVTGATAGQFIVPTNSNGAIIGIAINEADMTLAQYIKAVGKVIAIEQDGRAKIIVKVA